MELILKQDVENLGFKDDLVIVKNGFGRNFLIPHGKAVLATISAKKVLAEKLKQSINKQKEAISAAKKLASKLEKLDLKIQAKSLESDKLFGSVTSLEIKDPAPFSNTTMSTTPTLTANNHVFELLSTTQTQKDLGLTKTIHHGQSKIKSSTIISCLPCSVGSSVMQEFIAL